MIKIFLNALLSDTIAQTDYFGENGDLLIARGTLITQRHLTLLQYRNINDLFFNLETGQPAKTTPVIQPAAEIHPADEPLTGTKKGLEGLLELASSAVVTQLDNDLEKQLLVDRPAGKALSSVMTQLSVGERTTGYKETVSTNYEAAVRETEALLNRLAFKKSADAKDVEYIVKQFTRTFVTDRNILLNIAGFKPKSGEYLYYHSLNVCLLALNVAASYGYSEEQVVEIGMGGLLHDIGMLLVPKEIREKPTRYTKEEWYEIQKHPMLGLHLLERLRGMPERIAFVAYQVHERENGSGYPKQRQGRTIHRYAKMVQVADVYEAMTAPRKHRPPVIPYDGMNKILQMSKAGLLPIDAVKAFVEYVSLFPVGSLVELSDHRIAKVVQANKAAVSRPAVTILTDENGARFPLGKAPQLDLSVRPTVKIARALPPDYLENISIMDGF
ncbi:MAG: HD-GYP domain-containing protein [Chitinispirillaceae bacterium]|jgi:HD-GYP domain-containing protein (c-di-GMP phosphodiesterase class II)|nr:HD-GYP domain-containing protein [Chitinispirillaceae bacterium]